MGKTTRRGSLAVAAAIAATLAFAPAAGAIEPIGANEDDTDIIGEIDNSGSVDVVRIAGTDRVATAIKALEARADYWGDTVIIARSDAFADALASAPLADVLDAPILITPSGTDLDNRVADAVAEQGFSNAIFVGGTGALGEAMRTELETKAGVTTERIRGIDRFETALAIADATVNYYGLESGAPFNEVNVYLADGWDFADALAGGAAAADNDGVVLLTEEDGLPTSTRLAVSLLAQDGYFDGDAINHVEIHAVGGPAARGAAASDINVDAEYVGKDRFETAVLLAEKYTFEHDEDEAELDEIEKSFTVANGFSYADGVVAGAFAANQDGPLLLTHPNVLTGVTKDYLFKHADNDDAQVVVFGGTGSVTPAVNAQLKALFAL